LSSVICCPIAANAATNSTPAAHRQNTGAAEHLQNTGNTPAEHRQNTGQNTGRTPAEHRKHTGRQHTGKSHRHL
jgi:hypothetical protein